VRLRLALAYTALFVVTGTALLGVSYLLVQHREKGAGTAVSVICSRTVDGQIGVQISGTASGIGPPPSALNPANCPGAVVTYYRSSAAGSSGGAAVVAPASQVPLPGPNATEVGQLAAAVKASQAHTLDSFKTESALALGLITILSFGLSWWMAGRALRPVHRITDTALMLSERTLHSRINLAGPNDELKQLADTFDAMLSRLERAFRSQRRFVANASHELRTPLATERVLIDEALANRSATPAELRSILEELRANSEDTERLIDALLTLARSERGIEEASPVDLSAVVSSVLEQTAAEAAVAGVTVHSDMQPVSVSGDSGLVERLAGNLVENAIWHNIPGGSITVKTRSDPDTAVLEVVNTGPVIDLAAVATLIEPFRRAGPDRSSSNGRVGLGLSIVDAIVNAHHGRLHITARPEGGLEIHVRLPLARSGQPDRNPPTPPPRAGQTPTGDTPAGQKRHLPLRRRA
jgi:signal transduction histidine kinase